MSSDYEPMFLDHLLAALRDALGFVAGVCFVVAIGLGYLLGADALARLWGALLGGL